MSALCVDLATGQDVVFDTATGPVSLDHLAASSALIPDFPPVEVDGRLLVDGGFWANLPLDLVLGAPHAEGLRCIAVDTLPAASPWPRGLLQAAQRQTDLMFACQSERALRATQHLWQGRDPGGDLLHAVYGALDEETAMKGFEFSPSSVQRRWQAGAADMARGLALGSPASGPGLTVRRA